MKYKKIYRIENLALLQLRDEVVAADQFMKPSNSEALFMAPEMLSKTETVVQGTAAADVWSLGLIMFIIVTGDVNACLDTDMRQNF